MGANLFLGAPFSGLTRPSLTLNLANLFLDSEVIDQWVGEPIRANDPQDSNFIFSSLNSDISHRRLTQNSHAFATLGTQLQLRSGLQGVSMGWGHYPLAHPVLGSIRLAANLTARDDRNNLRIQTHISVGVDLSLFEGFLTFTASASFVNRLFVNLEPELSLAGTQSQLGLALQLRVLQGAFNLVFFKRDLEATSPIDAVNVRLDPFRMAEAIHRI